MPQILYMGLCLALFGSPLLMAFFKSIDANQFSPIPRFGLWVLALTLLCIAAKYFENWRAYFGFFWLTWQALGLAILTTATLLIVLSAYVSVRGKFASASAEQIKLQQSLFRLPLAQRCFVVVTAAVTEELLYRGYAIGIGQHLLGSIWLACVLSVAVFTLAHLRMGLANLVPVFACALAITLLFTVTNNLWSCIVVHAILDGIAVIVMPIVAGRKKVMPANGENFT
jgi:membrane protease YdiL (CAAX protease family)